jgi:hypothetical protein
VKQVWNYEERRHEESEVEQEIEQVVYYQAGVGTETSNGAGGSTYDHLIL